MKKSINKQRMELTPFYYMKKKVTVDDAKKYIKKITKDFKNVAKKEGYWLPVFYFEYLITAILCLNTPKDFIVSEQYKHSIIEKYKMPSELKWMLIDHAYNKNVIIDEERNLVVKPLFIKKYKDFIGRESIVAGDYSINEIKEFIKKHENVVCKPISGSGGRGVFGLTYELASDEKIKQLQHDSYLIEERIKQHPEMNAINPNSVNTVRIITAIDKNNNVHIVDGYLRAGFGDSVTDNTSSGGYEFPIDIETGIVSGPGYNFSTHDYDIFHKSTKKKMVGFEIPNYDKAIELVKKAALMAPSIRWVGWDVAIRENDAVLIEGNSNYPGGNIWERNFKHLRRFL